MPQKRPEFKPIVERLKSRTIVKENGCMEWGGCLDPSGYGLIRVDKKQFKAHRVSYEIHKGPIPTGMILLHSCDNPPCINPDHLSAGTKADNALDMKIKGRAKQHGDRLNHNISNGGASLEKKLKRRTKVDNTTGCFIWIGSRTKSGYGRVSHMTKLVLTHRAAFEIQNGPIAKGLLVCHKCDNPPCINPDHLFLGTRKENVQDMVDKGRNIKGPKLGSKIRGELAGAAFLTEEKVRAIRALKGVKSQPEIGKMFGVSKSLIGAILRGELWKHLIE